MELSLGLAFMAGLASFLSPCVFALVPAYIGYLSGRSIGSESGHERPERWHTFRHGFAFVAGFTLIFVLLGLTASILGQLTAQISPILSRIGGVIVVVFGLHMTGLIHVPFLDYELRPQNRLHKQQGYFTSVVMGVIFSAGWTPCNGPVLGAILTLAYNTANLGRGSILLLAYSLGLGIPFLAAALGIGWVTFLLKKYQKLLHYIQVGMGVVLILVGLLLFLGLFSQVSQLSPFINLGF